MISTATAAVKANVALLAAPSQKPSVAAAMPETTGTKTPETRSASRCTGRLARLRVGDEPGDLRERGVGADAGRAHDERAAGVDRRAGDLVARAASRRDGLAGEQRLVDGGVPSSTTPSVATFSPGRTTKRSPGRSCSTGTRRSARRAEHATSLAPSSSSAVSARPARRLARASK
jgi:hypothetical protein